MHDLHEGVLKYVMCDILYFFIREREYFNIDTLIRRVENFDYGPVDCGNRPPSHKITLERITSGNLKMSASEMMCFTRFFGEIVGDLVPEDDNVWELYLLLREILDIILSPKFVRGTEVYLQGLIEAFLSLYIDLFHRQLTIKFHLLLHYPFLMSLLGPLILLWCMRDEARHRESRIIAHSTNSRVRLELTLMIKHQLKFCTRLLSKRGLYIDFACGRGQELSLNQLPQLNFVENILPVMGDDLLLSVQWAKMYGTIYKIGMVLIVGKIDSFPLFGRIGAILVSDSSDIIFVVNLFVTQYFNRHYHAFQLLDGDAWHAVCHANLDYPFPLCARESTSAGTLISVKYL